MIAVISSGGKQYTVKAGSFVDIEKIEANAGDKINFDALLTSGENGVTIGNPTISGVVVKGEIIKQFKDEKITVFTYKAKKNVRKKQGHRQPYTRVKILSIE